MKKVVLAASLVAGATLLAPALVSFAQSLDDTASSPDGGGFLDTLDEESSPLASPAGDEESSPDVLPTEEDETGLPTGLPETGLGGMAQ